MTSKIVELIGAILTEEVKRSGRRIAQASIDKTALRPIIRNGQQTGTQMAPESPMLSDLHDAHVLCSFEQLDFFAAFGEAAEHEYEQYVEDVLAAKGGF